MNISKSQIKTIGDTSGKNRQRQARRRHETTVPRDQRTKQTNRRINLGYIRNKESFRKERDNDKKGLSGGPRD